MTDTSPEQQLELRLYARTETYEPFRDIQGPDEQPFREPKEVRVHEIDYRLPEGQQESTRTVTVCITNGDIRFTNNFRIKHGLEPLTDASEAWYHEKLQQNKEARILREQQRARWMAQPLLTRLVKRVKGERELV